MCCWFISNNSFMCYSFSPNSIHHFLCCPFQRSEASLCPLCESSRESIFHFSVLFSGCPVKEVSELMRYCTITIALCEIDNIVIWFIVCRSFTRSSSTKGYRETLFSIQCFYIYTSYVFQILHSPYKVHNTFLRRSIIHVVTELCRLISKEILDLLRT